MPRDNEKQRVFSRRAVMLGGLQLVGFSVLLGRLVHLQLVKDDEYATQSENNRIKLQLIAPERGHLLDRYGEILADSTRNYQLYIDFSGLNRELFNAAYQRLKELITLPAKTVERLNIIKVRPSTRPELLKENLSWNEVSTLEMHAMDLPGMYINLGQLRHYPLEDEAAHLIGYVGAVSEDELSDDDQPLMRLPDFKIGKNGIEEMLEDRLRGTAGVKRLEVNVHGIAVREISKQDSIPGETINLTIDKRLQKLASDLIKEQSASVILMEVDTGNILTLASMPAFDPNSFSLGIASDYWKELNANKKVPLMNKAIAGQYPPGSTFKMLVGMSALEAGIIKPSTTIHCPGYFMYGDHRFTCWKTEGHGTMNYKSAIQQSCDTFFYTVGGKTGIDIIGGMARKLGLGKESGIGLVGEKPGIVPDEEWKMKRYSQKWTGGDTINCAIGQGYVLGTPMQLVTMLSRIVNGGLTVRPRLLINKGDENPVFASMGISDDILGAAIEGMIAVVNEPQGTAYAHRITDPKFAFGGKTGTSQVHKITVHGVNQNTLPWELRHHAFFVGFAPITKPKYAIAVAVEHGGGGASAAAPIAQVMLQRVQELG